MITPMSSPRGVTPDCVHVNLFHEKEPRLSLGHDEPERTSNPGLRERDVSRRRGTVASGLFGMSTDEV